MNYDPIQTCPYDPVHRIMRSRMQIHVSKCAKNFPNAPKKQCPYDARHIVNEIEFNYHISICPERESVLHYKIVENKAVETSKILPIDPTPAAAQTEENWEEDGKFKSYDPMKHTENRPVIRTLAGAQKSERKEYQRKERRRISELEDGIKIEKDSATQNNSNQRVFSPIKLSIPEEAEEEYKPLRRPKKLPHNASKISDFSTLNDSSVVNETLYSVKQNESLQAVLSEKSDAKKNVALQPREMYSYAAALKKQQNSSIESDFDVVIESVKFDVDKENDSSFSNSIIDENLIKVSKTVEKLTIGDKGHKVESDSLDRTLESLKKTEDKSATSKKINNSNNSNNNNIFTEEKKSKRCAANFSNSKYQ